MTNPIISGIQVQPLGRHCHDDLRLIYPFEFPLMNGTFHATEGEIAPSLVIVTSSSKNEGDFLHASAFSATITSSLPAGPVDGMMHMFRHRSRHFPVVSGRQMAW